jgi:hypothetical protein
MSALTAPRSKKRTPDCCYSCWMRQLRRVALAMTLLAVAAGCGSNLRVTNIQLGRSLNADQTVATHTTRFTPNDTIYVSIQVAGTGSGTLGVRWTYQTLERVVGEPTKPVSGAGATEFHLQNAGGFPIGDYKVEAFLDGQPVGERTFQINPGR